MAQSHSFLQEIEHIQLSQQGSILVLKLTAYAADALRVLATMRQQAELFPHLEALLRDICPDWRNPGTMDDPADLIAQALFYAVDSLQKALSALERVTAAMQIQAEM